MIRCCIDDLLLTQPAFDPPAALYQTQKKPQPSVPYAHYSTKMDSVHCISRPDRAENMTPALIPARPGGSPDAQVGISKHYVGGPEGCNPFLYKCSILFALQTHTFASEEARVVFNSKHLSGISSSMGNCCVGARTLVCYSFQTFTVEL